MEMYSSRFTSRVSFQERRLRCLFWPSKRNIFMLYLEISTKITHKSTYPELKPVLDLNPLSEILTPNKDRFLPEETILTTTDKRCGRSGKTFSCISLTCQVNWYPAGQDHPDGLYLNT